MNCFEDPVHLVECLLARQDDAFEYLYEKYSKALYGVVLRIIKDADDADDILQEIFINIAQKISLYDTKKGTLFTWIINISRNKAVDALRKKEKKYCLRLEEQNIDHLNFKSTWNKNKVSTDTIGLRELVVKLKPDQREMIELHYLDGFTQQEITDLKGIPLGTVKTKIRSGMIALRAVYGIL